MNTYFLVSTFLLALLLYFPVSKLMWVLSVRRMQKSLGRELLLHELNNQHRRARMLAVFVVLVFAGLFNLTLQARLV